MKKIWEEEDTANYGQIQEFEPMSMMGLDFVGPVNTMLSHQGEVRTDSDRLLLEVYMGRKLCFSRSERSNPSPPVPHSSSIRVSQGCVH